MKYVYAYKTSDGVRHEETIDAPSREDAFSTLRARGIRAIKVVATDGSKANGEIRGVRKRMVALAVILAVAATAVALSLSQSEPLIAPPSSKALVELRERAEAIARCHKAAVEANIHNAEQMRRAIDKTRRDARESFKDILNALPNEREQREAKRLYGELMILADHSELELEAAESSRR